MAVGLYVDGSGRVWGDDASTLPVALGAGFSGPAQGSEVLADANATLTVSNKPILYMTPTASRNVTLPTTSVLKDAGFLVINLGNFDITVKASDATDVLVVPGKSSGQVYAKQAVPTTNTHWSKAVPAQEKHQVRLYTTNGYGAAATKIKRYLTTIENVGTAITYTDSAANGASFTVNVSGVYAIAAADSANAGTLSGLSLNSAQLTTSILAITASTVLAMSNPTATDAQATTYWTGYLNAGDVVRVHTVGDPESSVPERNYFTMSKI